MTERRRSQRIEPPQRLRARMKNGQWALVLDLSRHGAQLQTGLALGPRSECTVDLALGPGEVRLKGVVRRCRATLCLPDAGVVYCAGLEFVDLQPESRELFEEALVDLCLTEVGRSTREGTAFSSPTARSSAG
jgi:hypothetical protein